MTFQIQRVTPGDARLFDRVADGVFDEPIDPERLIAWLGAGGHLMVVALEDEQIIGQCAAVLHLHPDKPTELYVDEVGTADAHLRRGVAWALTREMFIWGKALGCVDSWLGTELDNAPANGLYLKLGGSQQHMHYYEFTL